MKYKKHGLITEGLSSEVFLLAFLEQNSGYAIARILEKSETRADEPKRMPTNYSKIKQALDLLTHEKYLGHDLDKKKYYPRISRFVKDIQSLLETRKVDLTADEIELLKIFLKRPDFLKVISNDVFQQMKKQPKGTHNVNALTIFCNKIGMISATVLFSKQYNPEYVKMIAENPTIPVSRLVKHFHEYDKVWDEPISQMDEMFTEKLKGVSLSEREEQVIDSYKNVIKSMPSMSSLLFAPTSTLVKFANMWDQFEGFKLGIDMTLSINKNLK